MIKVLIVEDSAVVRQFLEYVLNSDPEIQVIGAARDGEEALELVKEKKPDVITMDINMPRMDGFEATRRIMESFPTPIVIVSASWDAREVETTFRAMEAGAVAAVPKPRGGNHPELEPDVRELIQTVKLMSEVKVVRRWPARKSTPTVPQTLDARGKGARGDIEVVAIGASTGGPIPIQTILSGLPEEFPAPILVVQHISRGFVPGFTEWLSSSSRLKLKVASDGDLLDRGRVYIAPDGLHMGVRDGSRIELSSDEPEHSVRPSVSYLFRSVAKTYGRKSAGVLLSGMGIDGAEELKLMRDKGAATFVQDEKTSVVWGMPGEAVRLGAAQYVFPPYKIAGALISLANAVKT